MTWLFRSFVEAASAGWSEKHAKTATSSSTARVAPLLLLLLRLVVVMVVVVWLFVCLFVFWKDLHCTDAVDSVVVGMDCIMRFDRPEPCPV